MKISGAFPSITSPRSPKIKAFALGSILLLLFAVVGCGTVQDSGTKADPRLSQFSPEDLQRINAAPASGFSYVYTGHVDGGSAHHALAIVVKSKVPLAVGSVSAFEVFCSGHFFIGDVSVKEGNIVTLDPLTQLPSRWRFAFKQESADGHLTQVISDSDGGDSFNSRIPIGGLALLTAVTGPRGTWCMIPAPAVSAQPTQ